MELTAEGHHARGALDVCARHLSRLASLHIEAVAEKSLNDSRRDRHIWFEAGPIRLDIHAPLLSDAAEVLAHN